jgi:hypothetical protein
MNTLLGTEDHRYSLTTLQALHYGATYGGVSAHGTLRIQYTDNDGFFYEANVLSVSPAGVFARTDDGLQTDIPPCRILHAEVI